VTTRGHALDQVLKLANRYREHEGNYLQQSIEVGTSWEDYPQHGISGPITRGELLLEATTLDSQRMPRFFARVMAWGFGPAGYAAYRTDRILEWLDPSISDGSARLIKWISQLRDAAEVGPKEGLEFLGSDAGYVKFLGPSFSTKMLYFLSPEGNRGPIHDAVVNSWLWRQGVASRVAPIRLDHKDLAGYEEWVKFCDKALVNLKSDGQGQAHEDRGFIEYLIFQDQLRFDANSGLASWIRPSDLTVVSCPSE